MNVCTSTGTAEIEEVYERLVAREAKARSFWLARKRVGGLMCVQEH